MSMFYKAEFISNKIVCTKRHHDSLERDDSRGK